MRKYARYKDSGISWIGDVPEHWNLLRLKNTVTLICEKTSDSTLPYIGLENIVSWSGELLKGSYEPDADANKFEKDDVLFSKLRPYLAKCFLADFRGKCSSELLVFRDFQGEKRYLKNILLSYGFVDLVNASTYGTKMPRANWNFIGNCRIPVPPLPEQKAIAEYLDKKTAQINELVSAKQKQIELLKEYKQSVIANAVTGKLNKNSRMKDSGISWIGKIPENWESSTLRRHLKFVSDKGHPDEQLLSVTREQGVIIRNVESKEENHNAIPEDLSDYKLVKKGQFAINKMKSWQGSYGVSTYTGIVSPAYYVCDLDFENKDFFSIAIRSKAYIPFFTMYSKGIRVDQWDLSPIGLKTIPFFIPPAEEQDKIVSFVKDKMERIDSQIASIENQIANLNEYKQSLISDVVTGKVKVC